jgi:hypothetical protein
MESGRLQFGVERDSCLRRQGAGLAYQRVQHAAQRADALFSPCIVPRRFAGVRNHDPIVWRFGQRVSRRSGIRFADKDMRQHENLRRFPVILVH